MDKPKLPWGKTLELVLDEHPDIQKKPFLAYLEQRYRGLGDLAMMREIRAYRQMYGL